MDDAIVRRIERSLGTDGLANRLAELPASDFRSFMLAVDRRRAERVTPATLLRAYSRDRYAIPSSVDPHALNAFERDAFSLLPAGFEALDLSPLAPLGSSAALAPISQDWVVTTTRRLEVVSDPTNVLALEAALRRRADRRGPVKLAAAHRVVRGQRFSAEHHRQHFRLLSLVTAVRDRFEPVAEHLDFYVRLLANPPGLACRPVRATLTPVGTSADGWEREVLEPLRGRHPATRFELDHDREVPESYYRDACFAVDVGDGERTATLVDGGFTDWTQQLLGDRKERLLISGIGSEALFLLFGQAA